MRISAIARPPAFYTILSTPGLVADVQDWLDDPARNFGWILIGNETTFPSSKQFDSGDYPIAAYRPALTIEYTSAPAASGRVPDGTSLSGTPLTVTPAPGGDVTLTWGASCNAGDSDYEVYTGVIGSFTQCSPIACTTAGQLSMTITPSSGSQFFLVVPRNAVSEGSYGLTSAGVERPPSGSPCLSQLIAACP